VRKSRLGYTSHGICGNRRSLKQIAFSIKAANILKSRVYSVSNLQLFDHWHNFLFSTFKANSGRGRISSRSTSTTSQRWARRALYLFQYSKNVTAKSAEFD
jgi:hypothetical protein